MIWQFSNDSHYNISGTEAEATLAVRRKKNVPASVKRKRPADDVRFLAWLVLAFAILASAAIFFLPHPQSAHLKLYIGEQERAFKGEVIRDMTVLDALNASAVAGNVPLQFMVESGRTKILNLGGLSRANISEQLLVFRNGQRISPSVLNKEPVSAGDEITVRLLLQRSTVQ